MTRTCTHPLSLSHIHIDNRRVNYNELLGLLSFSFVRSCPLKHINSVVCSGVERRRSNKNKKEEINAILSLDGSRVYSIVNDASPNGVVFNCLPVKVKLCRWCRVRYSFSFFL